MNHLALPFCIENGPGVAFQDLQMHDSIRKLYESLFSYETRLRFYKLRHQQQYREIRHKVYPSNKGDFSLKPFDQHRCLFIHITKTAGTSVAKSLFEYLPYHYTAVDYRVIYGHRDFDDYFKFAFVRNPWDRLYSAWRYLAAGGWNDDDRQWYQDNLSRYPDFESFVNEWLNDDNILKHRHFWPQSRFTCDSKGLLLDHVGYFETLEQDFNIIASRLGIDVKLGKHNANPGKDYRDAYTDEMQQRVAHVYAKDIELFGYRFDGIDNRIQNEHD